MDELHRPVFLNAKFKMQNAKLRKISANAEIFFLVAGGRGAKERKFFAEGEKFNVKTKSESFRPPFSKGGQVEGG